MRAIILIQAYNKEICKENKACNKFSEMLENSLFEHFVHVSLQHILYLLQLLLVNQIEKIVDEMDWALVKVKGGITASAAGLTGERSAKTEHFDWKKNVYKWCF